MFANMDGEDGWEVIVSWSIYSNVQKMVRIYSFGIDGTFVEVPTSYIDPETLESRDVIYNELLYGDFDNDGKEELLTFAMASATSQTDAKANMIEYYYNSDTHEPFATVTWSAAIDNSVISYQKIKTCYISEGSPVSNMDDAQETAGLYAVVLDGVNAQNMMVTDVVCWDSSTGMFSAPFCNAESGLSTAFVRSDWILSQDINADGLVELPSAELMPSYTEESAEKLYMLRWNRYISNSENHIVPVMNTIHNSNDGYYMVIPDSWVGKITAKMDVANSTLYFYVFDSETNSFGTELFRIYVCSEEDYLQLEDKGFFKLATVGTKVYCARVQEEFTVEGNILTQEGISSLFKLIE